MIGCDFFFTVIVINSSFITLNSSTYGSYIVPLRTVNDAVAFLTRKDSFVNSTLQITKCCFGAERCFWLTFEC